VILIALSAACSSPSRSASDAGEQPTFDAEFTKGEFGGACSKHTDCTLGFCVEPVGNTGGVCSRTCADDCPEGWECRTVHLPEVDLPLCIPAAQQLCLACANDEECGGGSCLQIDGAGRCATPCSDECPVGYTCATDAEGTHAGTFCQPVTGSCECSAAMAGATRSCSEMNGVGTCFGTQLCDPATGWSACTATTPAAETCDGADNNCNFIIDDGVGGGQACTNTVAGVGSCPGVQACDGSSGFVCLGQTPTAEKCNFADDNCNGTVDEGFAGLGSSCTAGIGACTRYGSQRCNMAGTGTVCSAVAGAPTTELCNQLDDDCNNMVDEPFKTGAMALATQCAAGLGVCARYGSYICKPDGTGTQCSATPGTNISTETCNYLDDNCDGTVDNGFRNTTTGFYDTDTNCGSCGNNCTTTFTAQNSFGACVVATSPGCVMRCNPGTGNLNGSTVDGCEFTLDATAIYVSTTDATAADDATCGLGPTGTGTGNHPCKTITLGLSRAVATSRANVLVADGTYNEGVTLVSGKNMLGAYRADTWERHLSTTSTVIAGATSVGNHDRTIAASGITAATILEGFVIRGSFNTKPSGNSYAVYIATSNASLVVRNNKIVAGRGGAGSAGMPGTNGTQGLNGGGAQSATDAFYSAAAVSGCSGNPATITVVRQYLNGAPMTCGGGDVVSGGNGGGNKCPPSWGENIVPKQATEKSAVDGLGGQPGAGAGGGAAGTGTDAGDDGFIYQDALRCTIPAAPTFGVDGGSGLAGTSAPAVAGCTASSGSVASGDWSGGTGANGLVGNNGGGGGGGGAGGGAYCYDCDTNPVKTGGNHRVGGHGGGGGSGGCGGDGGGGGASGGGVFGIFITGGSAPTITGNSITRGDAGGGGTGGIGGAGGLGGTGGNGGQSALFCTDKAGRGGDGGNAGHGSGGGGGCGGSSFGIFTSGIGSPAYCGTNTVTGGAAGAGGAGGYSGGNTGGAGVAGVLQACTSI
jgi:hypothetical protein